MIPPKMFSFFFIYIVYFKKVSWKPTKLVHKTTNGLQLEGKKSELQDVFFQPPMSMRGWVCGPFYICFFQETAPETLPLGL